MLSCLQKLGVPGICQHPFKESSQIINEMFREGRLKDLWHVQNAAIISSVWQDGSLEGQVHGHSVSLRNRELGEASRGISGCSRHGGLSTSEQYVSLMRIFKIFTVIGSVLLLPISISAGNQSNQGEV